MSVSLGSCPPSPKAVVVKKPGGVEVVLDIPGDFETVSGIDEEKYVFYGHVIVAFSILQPLHCFVYLTYRY